jgi:uncharacterized membrane-anchored protein YitT (DUF2179 family)
MGGSDFGVSTLRYGIHAAVGTILFWFYVLALTLALIILSVLSVLGRMKYRKLTTSYLCGVWHRVLSFQLRYELVDLQGRHKRAQVCF